MGCKESTNGGIVKFFPVVGLEGKNGTTKLGGDVGVEGSECGEGVRLATKGKSPHKVRVVIKYHQIIEIARVASNRGGPNITMNQLEWKSGDSGRRTKGKRDMFAETTSLTGMMGKFTT